MSEGITRVSEEADYLFKKYINTVRGNAPEGERVPDSSVRMEYKLPSVNGKVSFIVNDNGVVEISIVSLNALLEKCGFILDRWEKY